MKAKLKTLVIILMFFSFVFFILPIFYTPARNLLHIFFAPLVENPQLPYQQSVEENKIRMLYQKAEESSLAQARINELEGEIISLRKDLALPRTNLKEKGIAGEINNRQSKILTRYKLSSGKISSRHTITWNSKLTVRIHKDLAKEVRVNDAVTAAGKYLGRVESIEKNYATIQTIFHPKSKTPVKLQGTNHFALLQGSGAAETIAFHFPRDVEIKKGDVLVTVGSHKTPGEIPVARILTWQKTEISQKLEVELIIPIDEIKYLFIHPQSL